MPATQTTPHTTPTTRLRPFLIGSPFLIRLPLMRPCDIMAAKPCPNLARTHALYTRFPLCFRCVLPCASLTFPVFRTQFRYEQASNSIGFAYAQLRETDAKPPLVPIAQLLHARRRSFERSNNLFFLFLKSCAFLHNSTHFPFSNDKKRSLWQN